MLLIHLQIKIQNPSFVFALVASIDDPGLQRPPFYSQKFVVWPQSLIPKHMMNSKINCLHLLMTMRTKFLSWPCLYKAQASISNNFLYHCSISCTWLAEANKRLQRREQEQIWKSTFNHLRIILKTMHNLHHFES